MPETRSGKAISNDNKEVDIEKFDKFKVDPDLFKPDLFGSRENDGEAKRKLRDSFA